MAYVRTVKTGSGATAAQIVHSSRGGSRAISSTSVPVEQGDSGFHVLASAGGLMVAGVGVAESAAQSPQYGQTA